MATVNTPCKSLLWSNFLRSHRSQRAKSLQWMHLYFDEAMATIVIAIAHMVITGYWLGLALWHNSLWTHQAKQTLVLGHCNCIHEAVLAVNALILFGKPFKVSLKFLVLWREFLDKSLGQHYNRRGEGIWVSGIVFYYTSNQHRVHLVHLILSSGLHVRHLILWTKRKA